MYANQFSIGGYYSGLPGWEFSVEGYYKQMKHILEYQDGVSFFGTSTNWEEKVEMGEGRSFGLELMVQKTLGKTTGWLAYTLSKTCLLYTSLLQCGDKGMEHSFSGRIHKVH